MFEFKGKHIIAEFFGVPLNYLEDKDLMYSLLKKGIKKIGVTELNYCFHIFDPSGYTLLILLAESHISIHTYPEKNSFFMDIFTCGNNDPEVILNLLKENINANNVKERIFIRGE